MARILIRPEDLARLAQRLDAMADDLARARRKLQRESAEVRLNRADESFPAARFDERSRLIASNLRRLADETSVDAALMAQTVDDVEFDTENDWTSGLMGAGGSGAPVGWAAVAVALGSVGPAPVGPSRASGDEGQPGIAPGGLFVNGHSDDGAEGGGLAALDRLATRLGSAPGEPTPSANSGAVWSRLVAELFTDDRP